MRGKTLDIKEHKKWKYDNNPCIGCDTNELLTCSGFCEGNESNSDNISYSLVFGDSLSVMVRVAKDVRKRLKVKDKILEAG